MKLKVQETYDNEDTSASMWEAVILCLVDLVSEELLHVRGCNLKEVYPFTSEAVAINGGLLKLRDQDIVATEDTSASM